MEDQLDHYGNPVFRMFHITAKYTSNWSFGGTISEAFTGCRTESDVVEFLKEEGYKSNVELISYSIERIK